MEDFGYRKLIVWQKSVELVGLVYEEIKKFPLDERFALIDQLRRSVVSIPSLYKLILALSSRSWTCPHRGQVHFLSFNFKSIFL